MNREDLEKRTKEFALQVIRFVSDLPKSKATNVIGHQLLKSGTSIGANYRETSRAEVQKSQGARVRRSEEKAMNIDRVQELLRAHRARLKEEFHVEQIGLFGSLVRRENASQSDIDILVTFQKGHKDFFNYMRVKSFLEDLTGREVDLVLKDAIKPRLQDRILTEVEYVP